MQTLNKIFVALLIVGGLNWGLVGLFNFDAVGWLFGGTTALLSRIVFVVVGAAAIAALFAATILRGYWIALQARDRFSTVLASGLVTLIAVQTILNLCVVTNLLPSTGIALPFFSYGGTALAVNLGEMGIVLQISRQRNQRKIQEEIL